MSLQLSTGYRARCDVFRLIECRCAKRQARRGERKAQARQARQGGYAAPSRIPTAATAAAAATLLHLHPPTRAATSDQSVERRRRAIADSGGDGGTTMQTHTVCGAGSGPQAHCGRAEHPANWPKWSAVSQVYCRLCLTRLLDRRQRRRSARCACRLTQPMIQGGVLQPGSCASHERATAGLTMSPACVRCTWKQQSVFSPAWPGHR